MEVGGIPKKCNKMLAKMVIVNVTLMPKAMSLRTVSQRKRKVNRIFIAARMSDNKGGDSWYYNNLHNVATTLQARRLPVSQVKKSAGPVFYVLGTILSASSTKQFYDRDSLALPNLRSCGVVCISV
jgi:hypothetical protein